MPWVGGVKSAYSSRGKEKKTKIKGD